MWTPCTVDERKWNPELWGKVPHETNRTELWATNHWSDTWRHWDIFVLFRGLFPKLGISCCKWYALNIYGHLSSSSLPFNFITHPFTSVYLIISVSYVVVQLFLFCFSFPGFFHERVGRPDRRRRKQCSITLWAFKTLYSCGVEERRTWPLSLCKIWN